VGSLQPDAITLDLEMPKMDGFTFLRILMSSRPTPVIVISSYSQKENVFKALEFGALDFVPKPDRSYHDLKSIGEQLISKLMMAKNMQRPSSALRRSLKEISRIPRTKVTPSRRAPRKLIVIASSTGGPSALIDIITRVPSTTKAAILIAQHMPDKFTRTFAERLDKRSQIAVHEAQDGDVVSRAMAFVCPGRNCMEVNYSDGVYSLSVSGPEETDRYVPSADRLFRSAARAAGSQVTGIILTGMGDDGAHGARELLRAGGKVIAESEQTAVVYGMPGSAMRAGVVTRSLPLPEIGDWLAKLDS
jgi:two-component system chemotaxis response regulator CheB